MKRSAVAVLALLIACGSPTAPTPGGPAIAFSVSGDSADGAALFRASCAACHAPFDGFDLAYFSYDSATIDRRARGHVTPTEAALIAVYVRTLQTPKVPEMTLLFQPGGVVLAGGITSACDISFAVALFGVDAWPDTLTAAGLAAKDPRAVPVCRKLFPWSDEAPLPGTTITNSPLEWMGNDSLPPSALAWNGNAGNNALAAYRQNETAANLDALITAIEAALSATGNPEAFCRYLSSTQRNHQRCFDSRRFLSGAGAMRAVKYNEPPSERVVTVWWDAGDIARRSSKCTGCGLVRFQDQWANWMYVSWIFDPVHQPAIYTMEAPIFSILKRHAVWVALRSLVVREPGDFAEDTSPYMDFQKATGKAPAGTAWAFNASRLGLDELLRRINVGDIPPTSALRTESTGRLNTGMNNLSTKVSASEFATLNAIADQIRAALAP